jgi:hypothetical protein
LIVLVVAVPHCGAAPFRRCIEAALAALRSDPTRKAVAETGASTRDVQHSAAVDAKR